MLQLQTTQGTLDNINLRVERAGKTATRPAADLKFSVNVPNTTLEQLEEGLLRAMYRNPDEKHHQADMVADVGTLTTLRFPHMKPIGFTEDWPGYFAEIRNGEYEITDLDLDKVTLKSIVAKPLAGGTVQLSFSLGCHPTADDVASLYNLMGKEVALTLNPPSITTLQELRAEAASKGGKGSDDDDDGQDSAQGQLPDAGMTDSGRAFPSAIDGRKPH